jgi:hypothetical protein
MAPLRLRSLPGVPLGLAVVWLASACGPPYSAKRTVQPGVDAEAEGGSGGEGGTGGVRPVDANEGGSGGDAGSGGGGSGGRLRDAAPDLAPDLAMDVAADVAADMATDVRVDAGQKTALLVMGFVPPADPAFKPGDVKLRMRLEASGFTVKIGDDDDPDASKATGVDLIVITDTSGAKVAAKYTNLAIPVICLDNTLLDDLKMTAAASEGTTAATQVAITDMASPLAAGLTNSVTVIGAATAMTWGTPPAAAMKVATIAGQANQLAIFAYPTGAMMNGLAAPAKRVGLFVTEAMAAAMNESGWKLFDAAVDWATQ